jgi:hypothetical protein
MNEMTEIASGTPGWSMKISAWHCPIVTGLYQLVGIRGRVSCDLGCFKLICTLEFENGFVCQRDKLVMFHITIVCD